jgi:hypothetical protein
LKQARARLRREGGQSTLEYGGLLILIAAVVGALSSLGLPTALAHAVTCEVRQLELNGCRSGSTAANAGRPTAVGPTGTAGAGRAAIEQALGSRTLIDACAGGASPNPVAEQQAPDSAACKQQLAKLSPKSLAAMALLAAALQAQEPGNRGSFAVLLQSYLQHPGWAVIALSPIAQAQQESGNTLLQKLQNSPGDLADGLLGSLCGGYGICLGGNVQTQAYQQAWHTSAQLNKISTPILYATGISAALKEAAAPALKAVLARLGARESTVVEQAAGQLEAGSKELAPIAGGSGPLPFTIDDTQFGIKAGKHAHEFGLDPSNTADRAELRQKITDIAEHPDEVVSGTFRGQGPGGSRGPVEFRIKGSDVVVTTPDGHFVTVLPNGINNPSVQAALAGNG